MIHYIQTITLLIFTKAYKLIIISCVQNNIEACENFSILEAIFQDYLGNVHNNKHAISHFQSTVFIGQKNRCLRCDAILERYENKANTMTLWIQQKPSKNKDKSLQKRWKIETYGKMETRIVEIIQRRSDLQLSVLTRLCDSFLTWRFEQEMQRS